MGIFIVPLIVSILCCLGTAGYAYAFCEAIFYCYNKRKRQVLQTLMWLSWSMFCTAASLNLTYVLWLTRALW